MRMLPLAELLLVTGTLMLAACSAPPARTEEPAPATPTPAITQTPRPTASPSPTPTETPTPTATPGPGLPVLLGTPGALAASAQLDAARAAYRELAELYPASADPWLGLAALAQREADSDAALAALVKAVEADPGSLDALRQLALFHEQQADYEQAVDAYSRMITLDPDDPDLLAARATALARLGRPEEAIRDLQAAQAIDPYRQHAWLNAAAAASGSRGYEAAAAIAAQGLEFFPDSGALHLTRGLALLSLGAPAPALPDFDAAVALNPLSVTAYHWRGRTLALLGRTEEAIRDLQQAGELGVLSGVGAVSEAYEAMADAADLIAQQDVEAAFAYLADQVIRHGSQDALLVGYARIDWRRGNPDLALGRLAAPARDGFVPALYWRAVIAAEKGDTEQAIADLQAFLAVRHSGPDAEAARELLESLGVSPPD